MIDQKTARARRWSLVLGSSIATLATASVSPAWAQCSPDPTVAGGTTNCTGTDSDGLRVTTNGSTVQVAASAKVTGSAGSAIIVDIAQQPGSYEARTATIRVGGSVDGGAQSGIAILSGSAQPNSLDFYGTKASVIIEAGATVTGGSGITAGPSAGNAYAPALVNVTNAGKISGSGGVALLATDPARGGFEAIDNAQAGTIGAIVGTIGQLTNAGLIDGGTLSAIDQTTTYNSGPYPGTWSNSGTIRSASSTATIANLSTTFDPLTNSGTIANTGTGAAIAGRVNSYGLDIINLAGGSITTAGQTAIVASSVTLINAGTIKGDIVAAPPLGSFYSTIDSTRGSIQGNVTLGGGNDLLYGRYDGTATLVTGITGTIDAGTGNNSLVLAPSTDLTVTTAINLPTGFQRLRLAPEVDRTLTLAAGFVAPGTIELAGDGTVVNQAAITTNGQAFVVPYTVSGAPHLINAGSVDATVTQGYYAVDLDQGRLTNSGTITSSGNGVRADDKVINRGTIVATNTAVSLFGGSLENSGTIRSTQGVGVELSGNTNNTPAINSGRIEGATFGAVIGYVLNNSGTIAATGNGTAVGLSNYGVLNNLAGGVISGGAYAISGRDPYGSSSVYAGEVFNAGTINGDVSFLAASSSGYNTANTFVAIAGGVLNGNLALGIGDTLVTEFVNTGPGQFAGINGTVTTNGGLLRYRVSADASAVIGAVGPFATTGYELVGGARLTLTATTPQTLSLVLAGNGTVDLTADITATNQGALTVAAAAVPPGTTQSGSQALTIVSRGTLSGTRNDYFGGGFGVVALGANTLQNEGTIRAAYTATNGGDSFNAAVVFGGVLINNGRIELEGSYGTYNVATVVNTGTIVQTGSRTSYGTIDASTVNNSGTIQTAGTAIQGAYDVTNSGTIVSTGSTAISNFGSSGQIANLAGGTIFGGNGIAIRGGGTVLNAGTIIGDVDLSSGYRNVYYASGGTLTGNLTLGSGDDLFLHSGTTTGVSGTINAGAGHDIYGLALTSSGTVAIGPAPGAGFEDAMVAALGTDTVATVTAVDASFTDLYAAGDGTVVNQASLAGRVITGSTSYSGHAAIVGETLGGLVNQGTIAGGVRGSVARIGNTGIITASGSGAVAIQTQGAALILENAGRIEASGDGAFAILATDGSAYTVRNTGTIRGAIRLGGGADLIENSGTIGPVDLGGGNDIFRFTGGSFASAIAGGAGNDTVEVAGGEIRFAAISDVETLRVSGGLATFSGTASFNEVALTGGRSIGLAGSTITAPTITVAQGATFGSAGIVNGNVAVAGTLSPGASPGTMTVKGNLSLASSSVSLFEITPTISDRLVVNGTLTIAAGATLQLEAGQAVTPGQSLDLIVADSITGSFTNIIKPASLLGFVVQQGDTIALLGQFRNDSSFTPQVQRSIDYVNGVLVGGEASGAFLAAVPGLVTASGTSNEAAFARLTPETYASAGQIAVEQGLELASAGRGDAFATRRDTPGVFSFASVLGNTRTLENNAQGTARARINGYGFLGGIGWGSSDWSIGGLLGYLNSRQTLSSLGARTEVDAIVAAIHGRWSAGKLGIKATVGYAGGNANSRRNLPGGTAEGEYDLTSWTGDFSVDYAVPLGRDWAVRPSLGLTAIRTSRDGATETGGNVYALRVASDRDDAVFIDGAVTFKGGLRDGAVFRPYLSIGMRYQVEGRSPFAVAALDGGDFGLVAAGARRAPMLATATFGSELALSSRLVLFGAVSGEAGDADRRASARAGLRLIF